MIRVTVVEDDPVAAVRLVGHLRQFERAHGVPLDIVVLPGGDALVDDYRADADLIFLDIAMDGLDGFSAAQRVRQVDDRVEIVFTTNLPSHAVRGYEVGALAFLLKPLHYADVAREIGRAVDRVRSHRRESAVVVPVDGVPTRLSVDGIVFLESGRRRTFVRTVDARYAVPRALKWVEEELAGQQIYRINNCYVVNLAHVVAVDRQDCVVSTGERLAISRLRRTAFVAALTEHLAGARP